MLKKKEKEERNLSMFQFQMLAVMQLWTFLLWMIKGISLTLQKIC